jgi:class 3 adenylate cyclase
MAAPAKKSFDRPDEHLEVPGIVADVVEMADSTISKNAFDPGVHCPQISAEGRPLCMAHHIGYVLAGTLHVQMQDGSIIEVGPNDVFDIPPAHDGWVVSDERWMAINWAGFRSWVAERTGERVLVTLVFTDVVGSTEKAAKLGDRAWRELLAQHYRSVRAVLDRYRGREVSTAGDGFLAAFDGAGRAISAALAIRDGAKRDGLSIRAGVHSGEVEIVGENLVGITVHEAARVAAAAGADEILVSEATKLLASGAPFAFVDRGAFQLKGLAGPRTLFAVAQVTEAASA